MGETEAPARDDEALLDQSCVLARAAHADPEQKPNKAADRLSADVEEAISLRHEVVRLYDAGRYDDAIPACASYAFDP